MFRHLTLKNNTTDFDQCSKKLLENILTQAEPTIAYIMQTFSSLQIHAIYQRSNWPNITPAQWVRIQPALVIASHYIACPLAIEFWHGLLWGPRWHTKNILGRGITHFDLVFNAHAGKPMPSSESSKIHDILNQLPQVTEIFIEDMKGAPCHGRTTTHETWRISPHANGLRSKTFLPREYLDRMESASPTELLRLWVGFGTTLAHETAHALWMASDGTRDEMAFRGDEWCEIGLAFEDWMFGGMHQESIRRDWQIIDLYCDVLEWYGVEIDERFRHRQK